MIPAVDIIKSSNRPKFYCEMNEGIVDEVDTEEENMVIEDSLNGRWSKLDTEISDIQKLSDFDSTNLGIDTDKGIEIAWNEMKFNKNSRAATLNRFENVNTLENVYKKLEGILNFLTKLDHPNILKFYDYWYVDNAQEAKLVVITEYSTAGSLKKVLDSSKMSQTKIKPQTYKRWLNQILYSIKCLHKEGISFFQGHLKSETIFIQSNGVIKLTPTLLTLNGVCEFLDHIIKCDILSTANCKKSNIELIKLNNEIKAKDLHAVGRLAIEIFTAHIKCSSPMSPVSGRHRFQAQSSLDYINSIIKLAEETDTDIFYRNLPAFDDDLQKDFVYECLNASSNTNIETIWFHPFINNIHSLKILSVHSILTFFQEKKSYSEHNKKNPKITLNSETSNDNESKENEIKKVYVNDDDRDKSSSDTNTGEEGSKESDHNNNNLQVQTNLSPSSITNSNESNTEQAQSTLTRKSSSNSSLSKCGSLSKLKYPAHVNRRKVSLTFLTTYHNLKIPQHFFVILEDIRSGLYPRLFKEVDLKDRSKPGNCDKVMDFVVIQQKQIIDRRSSSANFISLVTNEADKKNLARITGMDRDNSNSSSGNCSTNPNHKTETRRLAAENCIIRKSDKNSDMIELCLNFKFNDNSCRILQSYFPIEFLNYLEIDYEKSVENSNANTNNNNSNGINSFLIPNNPIRNEYDMFNGISSEGEDSFFTKIENICTHLANELIDYDLINSKDHNLVTELLLRTIKDHLINSREN